MEDQDLFSNDSLNFITLLLEKKSFVLENNEYYKKMHENFSKIDKASANIADKNMESLFEQFVAYHTQISLYESCLAYNLGIKKGINISKLK